MATSPNSVFAVRYAHPNASTSQTRRPLGDILPDIIGGVIQWKKD